LKKPKKGNYLKLKLYRFIILLDTFNKALEVVISKRSNNIIKEYKLLLL